MKSTVFATVGLGLLLTSSPSWSAPRTAPQARATALQAVFDCKRLTDAQLRLACYDRAAGALDAAESQGEVVVIDRAQARTVRRQAFGFNLPSVGSLFARGEKKEDSVERIQTSLTGAHQSSEGRWVFSTAEDQVWRQTESQELFRDPRAGAAFVVRKGVLGAFFCNVDGQAAGRCMRER